MGNMEGLHSVQQVRINSIVEVENTPFEKTCQVKIGLIVFLITACFVLFVLYMFLVSGTGKTESVKSLGNQLGRFVLVFNCDETFDFQAMGRIFVGLCQV